MDEVDKLRIKTYVVYLEKRREHCILAGDIIQFHRADASIKILQKLSEE